MDILNPEPSHQETYLHSGTSASNFKITPWSIALGIALLAFLGFAIAWPIITDRILAEFKIATTTPQEAPSASQLSANWSTYENREFGITFSYPAAWGAIKEERREGCEGQDVTGLCAFVLLSVQDKQSGAYKLL